MCADREMGERERERRRGFPSVSVRDDTPTKFGWNGCLQVAIPPVCVQQYSALVTLCTALTTMLMLMKKATRPTGGLQQSMMKREAYYTPWD